MRTFGLGRTLKLKDRELDTLTDDVNERFVERGTLDSELVPQSVAQAISCSFILRIQCQSLSRSTFSFPWFARSNLDERFNSGFKVEATARLLLAGNGTLGHVGNTTTTLFSRRQISESIS
jgi:hypothetical protein